MSERLAKMAYQRITGHSGARKAVSARGTRAKRLTDAQELLRTHLGELGFDDVETEYRFCLDRRWLADLASPGRRLLFECDGGMWHGGHRRGKALEADYERQNRAQVEGWRILRFTNRQVLNGEALAWLKEHL